MSGKKGFSLLRPAPEPRIDPLPPDEAISVAQTAFQDARQTELSLLSSGFYKLLFAPGKVDYTRLIQARYAAREQLERAQQVAQLLDDAVKAFQAAAPRKGGYPD